MGSALLRTISYGSVPRRLITSHGAQTHTPPTPAPDHQPRPQLPAPCDPVAVHSSVADPPCGAILPPHPFPGVDAGVWVRTEPPGLPAATPSQATARVHHPTPSSAFSLDCVGGCQELELVAGNTTWARGPVRRWWAGACSCRRVSTSWGSYLGLSLYLIKVRYYFPNGNQV